MFRPVRVDPGNPPGGLALFTVTATVYSTVVIFTINTPLDQDFLSSHSTTSHLIDTILANLLLAQVIFWTKASYHRQADRRIKCDT